MSAGFDPTIFFTIHGPAHIRGMSLSRLFRYSYTKSEQNKNNKLSAHKMRALIIDQAELSESCQIYCLTSSNSSYINQHQFLYLISLTYNLRHDHKLFLQSLIAFL